jgi:hypothetical protein
LVLAKLTLALDLYRAAVQRAAIKVTTSKLPGKCKWASSTAKESVRIRASVLSRAGFVGAGRRAQIVASGADGSEEEVG